MTEILSVSKVRQAEALGKNVLIRGWVRTKRDSKGFSFLELNDGSSFGNIQVIAQENLENYETEVKKLTAGSSIAVWGTVEKSPGAKQPTEVHATKIEIYGFAPDTYPLQKKRHTLEFLRTISHLRPRTNTFGAVARVRNRICASIHQFFQEEGFYYIHTPIITASDCEGAGEMFQVTTLNLQNLPLTDKGEPDYAQDFFGKPSFLTVSGQLAVENFACALGKVYTFGPTFRAENSNTSRHLAEFWMVEPEMAFFELPENMELVERFLKRIIGDVLRDCPEDMAFFNDHMDSEKTLVARLTKIVESTFQKCSYTQAISILEKADREFQFPVKWGIDLQSEHERYLTEVHFNGPVIVYDYPKDIKAFYMRLNDDGKTVRAMDVLVPGVGEIVGGSEREYRPEVLENRMLEMGLNPADYWWYLDLRRFGTVPHSGFGLGLERMVMLITSVQNIRDVIPFPRTPGSADF
ncbi:MAG: asparagine--tRNA ligase [Planctomycetia bacterium]|nr:asparagine--tRNA ligase [Planctomycetia bacterium]